MNNNGMGNPHEEDYFYDGFRDAGQSEKWSEDVVYDPTCDPKHIDPDRYKMFEQFLCMFKDQMALGCGVFPVKRPAFVEPPFFSKPLIKTARILVNAGTESEILSFRIADRHRVIVTSIGVSVDQPQILSAQNLKFWFSVDDNIVPIFDDQTPPGNFAIGTAVPEFGQTTIFPGNTNSPFNIRDAGLVFLVRGPATLTFRAFNSDPAVNVQITPLMSLYEYWLQNNTEFEKGDIQV